MGGLGAGLGWRTAQERQRTKVEEGIRRKEMSESWNSMERQSQGMRCLHLERCECDGR